VGRDADVPEPPGVPRLAFAGTALLPGLINAHSHLELTGLAGRIDDDDFSAWIRSVRQLKAALPAAAFEAAARQGVRDGFAAGITTVLDTGDSGAVLPALVELGGAGVVFQEVFGPHPDQCDASLAELATRIDQLSPLVTDRVRLGVSPHAPYTVSGPLYRAVAELARIRGLPIAVHLAESPAETALVARAEGPFAEAWRARGIPPVALQGTPPPPAGARRSPVSWLDAHGVLTAKTLCIHAVQVDREDIAVLARCGAAVAHCPISNARHRHGTADPAAMLMEGIPVGVGTDSVISVGRLDLFAELRAARVLLGSSARATLSLATVQAAGLPGLDGKAGRLEPGYHGDVVALDVASTEDPNAIEELILAARPEAVRATFVSARPVYRRRNLA
jgi:5-methylthioadenosine/S-adenosylhomocysteine deaminase